MKLPRRSGAKDALAGPNLVGLRARIHSPTMTSHPTGTVIAVDGVILSIQVRADLLVAADVEDCTLLPDHGTLGGAELP